jgi:hypothetical protein
MSSWLDTLWAVGLLAVAAALDGLAVLLCRFAERDEQCTFDQQNVGTRLPLLSGADNRAANNGSVTV